MANTKAGMAGAWSILRFTLLVLVLGAALFGLLGGGPNPVRRVDAPAASLTLDAPALLRNGMFFESRIAVAAHRPVADAVIAVPAAMWRDVTINSMIPAASEEEVKDGEIRFHFGPLAAGDTLEFKVDGQVNPPRVGSGGGRLRLLDGEAELAALDAGLKVIY